VRDIVADPEYFDVSMDPNTVFSHPVKEGYTTFAYVIGGEGTFDQKEGYQMNKPGSGPVWQWVVGMGPIIRKRFSIPLPFPENRFMSRSRGGVPLS